MKCAWCGKEIEENAVKVTHSESVVEFVHPTDECGKEYVNSRGITKETGHKIELAGEKEN